MFSWHLSQSHTLSPGGVVRRPRHFLICRWDGAVLVVGRILHDAMDLRRQVDQERWERVDPAGRQPVPDVTSRLVTSDNELTTMFDPYRSTPLQLRLERAASTSSRFATGRPMAPSPTTSGC